MMISSEMMYNLSKLLYKMVLRDIIYGIVCDTKTQFDDNLLLVCDKMFGYAEIQDDDFAESMGKIIPSKEDTKCHGQL